MHPAPYPGARPPVQFRPARPRHARLSVDLNRVLIKSGATSMRSSSKSFKIPVPLLDGLDFLRQTGQPMADYPSTNAAVIGLIAYAVAFPREHQLTAGLSLLRPEEQDLVHDFLLAALQTGINLRDHLPKPAAAADLLALARRPLSDFTGPQSPTPQAAAAPDSASSRSPNLPSKSVPPPPTN